MGKIEMSSMLPVICGSIDVISLSFGLNYSLKKKIVIRF